MKERISIRKCGPYAGEKIINLDIMYSLWEYQVAFKGQFLRTECKRNLHLYHSPFDGKLIFNIDEKILKLLELGAN